jgi:hypothetical protein
MSVANRISSTMGGKPHPIHIHPARPLYRFAATGLGAGMWFFVSFMTVLCNLLLIMVAVDVSSEARWYSPNQSSNLSQI